MEDRISAINADTTNQLDVIQLESGVSSTSPGAARAIGLALFAGSVVGCAAALVLGSLTRRVESEFDLAERTGLAPLALVPRGSREQRARRYGQLANALSQANLPVPTVLAVAPGRDLGGTDTVARAIAGYRADQGVRSIVLDADLRAPGSGPGLAEYLGSEGAVDIEGLLQPSAQYPGVRELGRGEDVASIRAVDVGRLDRLLSELRQQADVVLVVAPPLIDSAESQVICSAADSTLLVVEQSVTKTADVREAKRLIGQVDGRIAGAVLLEKGAEASGPGWLTSSSPAEAASPSPAVSVSKEGEEHDVVWTEPEEPDLVWTEPVQPPRMRILRVADGGAGAAGDGRRREGAPVDGAVGVQSAPDEPEQGSHRDVTQLPTGSESWG